MSTAAGDHYPWPGDTGAPYWQWPPPNYYGHPQYQYRHWTTDNTKIAESPSEDRIREIIREELTRALENLK